MLAPQEVQRMLALRALGWGSKRISRELGCSRNTVRQYLRQGGWRPMDVAARSGVLGPHRQWLAERLRQHRGNADVVRQDLARELGIRVSLRTVQRAVEPQVKFNDRFHAFCRYWGVAPRACAPYRARTKGKDERGVGYVKRNAIAGHRFASLEALQAHLAHWMREIADLRVHGTTGEPPILRFQREATALKPLPAKAPFLQVRELTRRVHTDACIELDTNRYSVPWRLIGEAVTVVVAERQVRVLYAGHEMACHAQSPLRRTSVIDQRHLAGIVGGQHAGVSWLPKTLPPPPSIPAELLRPLEQYEAALGGAW